VRENVGVTLDEILAALVAGDFDSLVGVAEAKPRHS
jgi:hypothetical protein